MYIIYAPDIPDVEPRMQVDYMRACEIRDEIDRTHHRCCAVIDVIQTTRLPQEQKQKLRVLQGRKNDSE